MGSSVSSDVVPTEERRQAEKDAPTVPVTSSCSKKELVRAVHVRIQLPQTNTHPPTQPTIVPPRSTFPVFPPYPATLSRSLIPSPLSSFSPSFTSTQSQLSRLSFSPLFLASLSRLSLAPLLPRSTFPSLSSPSAPFFRHICFPARTQHKFSGFPAFCSSD